MLTSILPHNRSHKNPPKWWPMQAKIEIRKAPLIVSCIQSYTSSIYSFIHPLYRPLPRQSSCQCLHPESSHLCRYLSNPTTHRCASAASAHQISIVEFINFLEFVYAFFPGPGPNVPEPEQHMGKKFPMTQKRSPKTHLSPGISALYPSARRYCFSVDLSFAPVLLR